jgi:hypothetical protein
MSLSVVGMKPCYAQTFVLISDISVSRCWFIGKEFTKLVSKHSYVEARHRHPSWGAGTWPALARAELITSSERTRYQHSRIWQPETTLMKLVGDAENQAFTARLTDRRQDADQRLVLGVKLKRHTW